MSAAPYPDRGRILRTEDRFTGDMTKDVLAAAH